MKTPSPEMTKATEILKDCLAAWSEADVGRTASFYADNLEYRDPMVPQGIFSKEEFIRYLKTVFSVWPRQHWVPTNLMPHDRQGAFSVEYEFEFANDRTGIRGRGIDRIELQNGKIVLNHVYLNAEKWRDWIIRELKSAEG